MQKTRRRAETGNGAMVDFFAIYFVFCAIFTIFAAEMKLKTKKDETIKNLVINHHGGHTGYSMQQRTE